MIYRLNEEEQKQVNELHEKYKSAPGENEVLKDNIDNNFRELMASIEDKRFNEIAKDPNKIIESAKGLINDAILYEYVFIALPWLIDPNIPIPKEWDIKPVYLIEDSFIEEHKHIDIWFYYHGFIDKLSKEPPREPLILFDRKSIQEYIENKIIAKHIEAIKKFHKTKESKKIVNECLDHSMYICNEDKSQEEKGEEPFILNESKLGIRRIIETKQYIAMNSLVSKKLVSSKPKRGSKDIPGQYTMQWDIEDKDLVYFAAVDFKSDNNISVDTRLDINDMAIINAIGSLYTAHIKNNPGEPCDLILLDIWRLMIGAQSNEKIKMTDKQENMLIERIEKLRRSFFYMDMKSQMKKYGLTFDKRFSNSNGIADEALLNLTKTIVPTSNHKQVTDAYRVNKEPILFAYSRYRKQIISVNRNLLNIEKVSNGEDTIAFTNYLLRRLENYKNGFLNNNTIKLDTVYKETGIAAPNERIEREKYKNTNSYTMAIRRERKRDCAIIINILEAWKSKKYIDDYSKIGKGDNTAFIVNMKRKK